MEIFKKMTAWEKTHLKSPKTRLGLFVAVGMFIGVIIDNIALGFFVGIILGSINYAVFTKKKGKAKDLVDVTEDTNNTNKDT
ncbi:hypothetical protein COB80_00360 [Candidatus Kaiserbacteria bacterium]|nr:MAG: hypothetical protein COB80_00360 [Candidatus Kaiserbacteria bacterium]